MWQGTLRASFDARGLRDVFVIAPLKLQRPFARDGLCDLLLLHTAGGIVAGDRLDYQLNLAPGARVRCRTASAGKIYRSEGQTSHTQITIIQAPHSYLEWCPRESIVFSGAQHHQHLRLDLAPGAIWVGWDIVRLGRTARGEQFQQGTWRSDTEIWQTGSPLWLDRQQIRGGSGSLTSLNGLAGYPVMASLCLVGLPHYVPPTHPEWGSTQLPQATLLRHRGESSEAVLKHLSLELSAIRRLAFDTMQRN